MKDDSGNYATFMEQGASAPHVTVAKVLDVISRRPACYGQASDAVSACTQVEMKDAPKLRHLSEEDCLPIWIRLPKTRRIHYGTRLTIQWYRWNAIFAVIHCVDSHGTQILMNPCMKEDVKMSPNGSAYTFIAKQFRMLTT